MKKPIDDLPSRHPDRIAYNFACWREAMEISHVMLMAGLRNKVGPDGDIREAYSQWNEARRQRKLAAYDKAAERFFQRTRDTIVARGNDDAADSCG